MAKPRAIGNSIPIVPESRALNTNEKVLKRCQGKLVSIVKVVTKLPGGMKLSAVILLKSRLQSVVRAWAGGIALVKVPTRFKTSFLESITNS